MRNFHCVCGNTVYFESTKCLVCGRALVFLPQQLLLCTIEPQVLNRAISDTYFLANISSA